MDINLIAGIAAGALIVGGIFAIRTWWSNGKRARKGRLGEKQVAKVLASLKKKDNIVLNDLLITPSAGKTSQIDHIVVSTRGIFVIETKSHAGRITGSEHTQNWQQHLSTQSRTFYNPLLQNATHIRVLRKLLPDLDEDLFISMAVFTDAWRLEIKADSIVEERRFLPDKIIPRTLLPAERVKRSWWRRRKEVVLDEQKVVLTLDELPEEIKRRERIIPREELQEIADRIEAACLHSRSAQRTHTQYARQKATKTAGEIRSGICPRCGGALVVKKTANGEFLGCENFPACRFTCSIDLSH